MISVLELECVHGRHHVRVCFSKAPDSAHQFISKGTEIAAIGGVSSVCDLVLHPTEKLT